jgi:hypothetical protein
MQAVSGATGSGGCHHGANTVVVMSDLADAVAVVAQCCRS